MFFLIRKELGFSRPEWRQLSMEDQALYMEQLNWDLYRRKKQEWDDTPVGKRTGQMPQAPEPFFSTSEKPKQEQEQFPDIAETVPVENN